MSGFVEEAFGVRTGILSVWKKLETQTETVAIEYICLLYDFGRKTEMLGGVVAGRVFFTQNLAELGIGHISQKSGSLGLRLGPYSLAVCREGVVKSTP